MGITLGMGAISAFIMGSILYVYKFRGSVRYDRFTEYLRKGWPIFTPMNCLLYLSTKKRARKPIMDLADFPELSSIAENWTTISKEAQALVDNGFFDKTTTEGEGSYYDIGFRTFYKYGWSKFYLSWYGYTHASAQKHCPQTVEIISKVKGLNGAIFSFLPPGSQLTRHLDPAARSLRYHLGLSTPNNDACFINIDGQVHSWRDGEALLFDETYIHFAKNNSDKSRLILMCEVERPMNIIGQIVQFFYKGIVRFTVVPNTDEDKRGLVNRIFAGLAPVLKKSKNLKKTNLKLYKLMKHTVNTILFLIVAGLIYGLVKLVAGLF